LNFAASEEHVAIFANYLRMGGSTLFEVRLMNGSTATRPFLPKQIVAEIDCETSYSHELC